MVKDIRNSIDVGVESLIGYTKGCMGYFSKDA
jgi:hypothetical protein